MLLIAPQEFQNLFKLRPLNRQTHRTSSQIKTKISQKHLTETRLRDGGKLLRLFQEEIESKCINPVFMSDHLPSENLPKQPLHQPETTSQEKNTQKVSIVHEIT